MVMVFLIILIRIMPPPKDIWFMAMEQRLISTVTVFRMPLTLPDHSQSGFQPWMSDNSG